MNYSHFQLFFTWRLCTVERKWIICQTTEIADPTLVNTDTFKWIKYNDPISVNADTFKVFDSFSEFVKPISNQTKLPENLPFGFSVVQNSTDVRWWVTDIGWRDATGEGCNCCRNPFVRRFFKRFQILIFHRLCCLSNCSSIRELHKGIFCLKI